MLINNLEKNNTVRRFKMRKRINVKKSIALLMASVLFVQSAGFTKQVSADDTDTHDYSSLVWTDETTDEILEMMDNGLNLDTFFTGDLTKGTTVEDLIEWKSEGKDVSDVVLERAREKSAVLKSKTLNTEIIDNQDGTYTTSVSSKKYLASSDSDGKYYLTELTSYHGNDITAPSLFNPKTNVSGSATPWYIELGQQTALCCTFGAHASISKDHNYIQTDINTLKNNTYFAGGTDYPLEKYMRGAAYAYERIGALAGITGKTFTTGALDADLQEADRRLTAIGFPGFAAGMNKKQLYSVFQIIAWQISCGTFDGSNLATCERTAVDIFGQLYPAENYANNFGVAMTYIYDYFAACVMESGSGDFEQKFLKTSVQYWSVQGSDTANWQDFITWEVGPTVPKDEIYVTKYGQVISKTYKYPNATFYIYSDSGCTNKIGQFTTDSNGEAVINVVEGIYYLKEQNAPTGTVKNNNIITLTVNDKIMSADVTNNEIYNGIVFQKTSSLTGDVVHSAAKYTLYEYVSGKNTYMKLCDFSFLENGFTNSKGVKIPDYAYILTGGTSFTYHNSDGSVAKTITDSSFYYTPVNQGKFKIIEEEAPEGYKVNSNGYEFSMDLTEQGKILTIPANSIKDDSYRAGVKIAKYDALSAQKLDGVSFKIQEQINETWYDVGNLVYDETEEVYKTAAIENYFIHSSTGSVNQITGTSYPLYNSTANNGKYRIIETAKQNENYVNTYTKEFRVAPREDNYSYEFVLYDNGLGSSSASNIGKSISVKIAKFDSITSEKLTDSDRCTLSVYEYNHAMDEWQEVGKLVYNEETGLYETSSGVAYLPHKEDGTVSTASIGAVYKPGMLYYTSVNEGDYKLVETVNPANYLSGKLNDSMEIETFEKTFKINEFVSNNTVIDMTELVNAAKDTGIYLNVELSKYDSITKEKITDSEAVFTVYENVNGNWLEMGKLLYDSTSKMYITADNANNFIYHNSEGTVVSPGSSLAGLHYTTANKGRFKVVETSAPGKYLVGTEPYVKEFGFGDAKDGIVNLTDISSAPTDIGIKGTVSVKKYDAVTSEIVKSTDMTATVYEKIGDDWYEMGNLVYDAALKLYAGEGVSFVFHNEDGTQADTIGITDFEIGRLYYTTANKGQFKIVETAAPTFYTLVHPDIPSKYTKEFTLTTDNQKFEFHDMTEAIKNFGITVTVNVNKYDVITKDYTPSKDAVFVIQEYLADKDTWLDAVTLMYDETEGVYTTTGQTVEMHKPDGTVGCTNSEGKLYYTSQNLGQYRILEKSAPTYYISGSKQYVKEFNITSATTGNTINLTSVDKSAQNLGIYETVSVVKYDRITSEEVENKDAVFTVYEKVNGKWLESGILKYNESAKAYTGDGVSFVFHNEDGTKADTTDITDIEVGRLYYTSANQGQFKIVETVPPKHYTNEPLTGESSDIFEKEFTVDTNEENNNFNALHNAAKNTGRYTYVDLLKYDVLTKKNVEFKNAVFTVEEDINGEWLPTAQLKYDEESGVYTTRDTEVTLHNSTGEEVYSSSDGKLYYTTANKGRYRVRETKAPTNYTLAGFVKEFNVLDSTNELIDLTKQVDAANDLGIYSIVETAKYDSITNELVRTSDTEFTVYEYINKLGKWMESGRLVYDSSAQKYVSKDVQFKFHKEDGTEIGTAEIPDFRAGRLYYTTANKGRFKVVETNAPQHYTDGTFSKEFTVSRNGYVFSYVEPETGALNKGISVPVKVQKYDVLTKRETLFKDTIFEVQEYIADIDKWITVGQLAYDEETECYTSKDMNITYHSSTGDEIMNVTENALTYTSANLGAFRVVEAMSPTNYEEATEQYIYEFNITEDAVKDSENNDVIDITDRQKAARNLGKSGILKVAKYDSITKEKVLTGDAEFTVYEYIENIAQWIETGILVYDEENQEYICDGIDFVFHDETGEVIDLTDIPDFENGRLYYTTANKGKYKVAETNAPKNYRIDGFEREFDITEEMEVLYNDSSSAAYDTGIRSIVELVKADSLTNKKLAGAKFVVQEWSEFHHTWLTVGTLKDNGDGTYTTEGMDINLHTGTGAETVSVAELLYTTQNLGKYRILETEAPKGYLNDLYVSDILTVDTDLQVIELTSEDLQATDTPLRVGISKTSVTDGKMIIGATLTVKDIDGNIIDTWVTDGTEHIISAIPSGKYTLIEERAAEGYIVASNVEFEVTETNEIQKVTMVDEEVKGQIVINKTDKETGNKLAGAKFEIRDEDGNVIETLITDENGYAKSGLIAFGIYDANGTYKGSMKYTVVEVAAPSGYELDKTPVEVTFEYQDDKTPVVVKTVDHTNTKTPVIVKTGDSLDMAVVMIALLAVIAFIATATVFKRK